MNNKFKCSIFILILLLSLGVVSANEDADNLTADSNESLVQTQENDMQLTVSDIDENLSSVGSEVLTEDYFDDDNEYKVKINAKPFTVDWGSKKAFKVYVTDYWGDPVDSGYITFNWNNYKYKLDVEDGVAFSYICSSKKITTKTVTIKYVDDSNYYDSASVKTTFKTVKANTYIESGNPYYYGDDYYEFWLYPKGDGYGISGAKLKIQVKVGKKYKTFYRTTGSGHVVIHIKKLSLGKHKVIIKSLNKNVKLKTYKSNIVVKKAKINIKTSSSGKYIKIKAKDRYGAVAKNIKIKVKLYTGKHYKKVIVKTNKKGIAKVYVGGLSNNIYHKVKYSSANKNYYLKDYGGTNTDYVILSKGKALPLWWLP